MYSFSIDKKTGFSCNENPVIIYLKNDNLFYTTEHLKNYKGRFNLPKGEYKTANKLTACTPIEYKIKLPKPERNFVDNIDNAKIIFDENPNKCTIFHDKNIILFDNVFKNKPLLTLSCIIEHERGHKKYFTEWKADLFAYKKMLELGYNPSQIKATFITMLNKTPKNFERMKQYFNIF